MTEKVTVIAQSGVTVLMDKSVLEQVGKQLGFSEVTEYMWAAEGLIDDMACGQVVDKAKQETTTLLSLSHLSQEAWSWMKTTHDHRFATCSSTEPEIVFIQVSPGRFDEELLPDSVLDVMKWGMRRGLQGQFIRMYPGGPLAGLRYYSWLAEQEAAYDVDQH